MRLGFADLFAIAGFVVLSFALFQALWVVIPSMIFGWHPMAITSNSMMPSIRQGDVVLIDPGSRMPGPGSVVAVADGAATPVVHRVVSVTQSGYLATKGDASQRIDSMPVGDDQLIGTARLVVPMIGLLRTTAEELFGGARAAWVANSGNGSNTMTAVDLDAPTNLTVTCGLVGVTSLEVNLTWDASISPGTNGYQVWYEDTSGSGYVEVGTTLPGVTTFSHQIPAALVQLGIHSFKVRSISSPWSSEDSNIDSVTVIQAGPAFVCVET